MRTLLVSALFLTMLSVAAPAEEIIGTAGNDLLEGTEEPDRIRGLGGNDELFGLEGADVLEGGDGDDELFGGPGADSIEGGPGDDFLDGREGGDRLAGGPGRDVFAYYADIDNGADGIADFESGVDTIALHDFIATEITVGMEGEDTVIDLPGSAEIRLQGIESFDPGRIVYDIKRIIR